MRVRRFATIGWAALAGGIAGWLTRNADDPFVLDDPFWRDFWSGPPAAGVFALAGAVVAFGAAWIASATTRRGARRQEWWDRAEWALGHVMSNDGAARDVGLAAVEVLIGEATTTEARTPRGGEQVNADPITDAQRASAARIRMSYDKKRGHKTERWIENLAKGA